MLHVDRTVLNYVEPDDEHKQTGKVNLSKLLISSYVVSRCET